MKTIEKTIKAIRKVGRFCFQYQLEISLVLVGLLSIGCFFAGKYALECAMW